MHSRRAFAADAGLSILVGLLFTLVVVGAVPLNPSNTRWMTGDPATYQIGWDFYRQDPHLHWPLTFSCRLGHPLGASIALMDPNTLLALCFKLLSPLLPASFQYLGIQVWLLSILQFFFGVRLFRRFTPSQTGAWMAGMFLLVAPAMTYRLIGHFALANHWLILAALLLLWDGLRGPAEGLRRVAVSSIALVAVAVAINPYLAFEVIVLLLAGVAALVWRNPHAARRAAVFVGVLAAVAGTAAAACGLFIRGGEGYVAGGYRHYSMNLNAPFDPQAYGSLLLPKLSTYTVGQYEGYNYLGLGSIALAVFIPALLGVGVARYGGRLWRYWTARIRWRDVIPVVSACSALALLALSTKVSAGSVLVADLDPSEFLSPYLGALRASGRLFWPAYYLVLTALFAAPFRLLPAGRAAIAVGGLALLLQLADTQSLRRAVRATVVGNQGRDLRSPVWFNLGQKHRHLEVLPAWQCDGNTTPGGIDGYRIFGFLAARQRMTINSYYAARYDEKDRQYHCSTAPTLLASQPLDADTAYVVSPAIAATIASRPGAGTPCHEVDGFTLCSVHPVAGVRSIQIEPDADVTGDALENPGFEQSDLSGWAPFGGVSAASVELPDAHGGRRVLAISAGDGSVYQNAVGLKKSATYIFSAWARGDADGELSTQLGLWNPTGPTPVFSPIVRLGPQWQLLSQPFEVGATGKVTFHLFRHKGRGTVYWDDVRITLPPK